MTAAHYGHDAISPLAMPVRGIVATHAYDRLVPDAAAAASQLSTGYPARIGTVGFGIDGDEPIEAWTLLELAESRGKRTGLVTTTSLTHPAVSPYYAHLERGDDQDLAAEALADLGDAAGSDGIDVAIGGGGDWFSDATLAKLRGAGVLVDSAWSDQAIPGGARVVRIVARDALVDAGHRFSSSSPEPTLRRATEVAIDALAGSADGFVLVVHAGGLAEAIRNFDRSQRIIDEVVDFDEAVRAAMQFAATSRDTTVVVTGLRDSSLTLLDNHYAFSKGQCTVAERCGGTFRFLDLPIAVGHVHHNEGLTNVGLQGNFANPSILVQYSWLSLAANTAAGVEEQGSATMVPIFALGPGAAAFGGFHAQPEVGRLLQGLL
jgi:alkaline phosphatase